MQKLNVTVHVAAAFLLAAPGALPAQTSVDRGHLRAGAAKVDITPQKSELAVSTDSIRDHLFVHAIVVDDGRTCAVLAGLDLGGASNQIVDDAMARASKSTGCPAQNFIISSTHTHSSNTLGLGGRGAPTAKTVADAILEAANAAKSRLAPARVGYGTTKVDLNVNRDLFNSKLAWRREPNPDGPSDKTLALVEFLGNDNVPIAVYMNYAMHPINFYLSGVISADFPGEASRYVELGALIASSAVRVMRESIQPVDAARVWAAQENFVCPGRVRLDAANPARENVFPGYKEGPDVSLKVGVLRVGDINFVTVNGEVYSQIAMKLKANAPASKTIVVTLANGMANSGYTRRSVQPSHVSSDWVPLKARLRRRWDNFDCTRLDAPVG